MTSILRIGNQFERMRRCACYVATVASCARVAFQTTAGIAGGHLVMSCVMPLNNEDDILFSLRRGSRNRGIEEVYEVLVYQMYTVWGF